MMVKKCQMSKVPGKGIGMFNFTIGKDRGQPQMVKNNRIYCFDLSSVFLQKPHQDFAKYYFSLKHRYLQTYKITINLEKNP